MNNTSVLIVEDDQATNRLFSKYLSSNNYVCASVFTVDDALAAIASHEPDFIILDLDLGANSGIQVLDHLEANPQIKSRVIIVSGNAVSSMYSMKRDNVIHVLIKPVSPTTLAHLIQFKMRIINGREKEKSQDSCAQAGCC